MFSIERVYCGNYKIRYTNKKQTKFITIFFFIFRCTKEEESPECSRNASSFNILPPIVSAKLNTKNNFLFQYGKLEVEAKLPIGDWIVSGI